MRALTTVVVVAALLVAAVAGLLAVRERRPARWLLGLAAGVEVALAALLTLLVGRDPSLTAVGYALVALAALPGGLALGRGEAPRWASALVAGGALLVPVLVARTAQVTGG